ncbi:Hypothetical predicted protein [Olea europaea subsp. europaea]|uniref:Uncharacterized protein n=1 Tax=Olea europaea subsp. europaea TaxID=158383 RepID=A0A8S0R844_OLEEU|nr:Hypothetical predicted protein [Olea europaea subsp. europaea]
MVIIITSLAVPQDHLQSGWRWMDEGEYRKSLKVMVVVVKVEEEEEPSEVKRESRRRRVRVREVVTCMRMGNMSSFISYTNRMAFSQAWEATCKSSSTSSTMEVPSGKTFLINPLYFDGPCNNKIINVEGYSWWFTLAEFSEMEDSGVVFNTSFGEAVEETGVGRISDIIGLVG